MKYIGAHVSASGGVENAPENAFNIKATGFALFVKNQRRWSAPPLLDSSIKKFKAACEEYGYPPESILPHDSYLVNLGHPEEEKRIKSLDSFIDEARRCEQLGLKYLNFHPGSHLRQISEEECLDRIVASLTEAAEATESLVFLIENTAGQGSNVGYRFEHLAYLIDRFPDKSRIGVCLDTCHTLASGYDIAGQYDMVFEAFDKTVGFSYLKAFHVNDSKKDLASRVDRHHNLEQGFIPLDFFRRLLGDPRFDGLPFILETPEEELWPGEIEMLKGFVPGT